MVKKYFFTISFVSWMMFVTFSSLHSFEGVSTPSFNIPHFDKFVHFTFYFVACFLGIFALRERTKGSMPMVRAVVVVVIATIVFGIGIEIIQHTMTANREGDILDGLANTIGSLCGATALKMFFSVKRELKWKV